MATEPVTSRKLTATTSSTALAVTSMMVPGRYFASTSQVTSERVLTAVRRFLRPVTFQDAPASVLPAALQDANPLHVPQTVNAAGASAAWGDKV